MFLFFWCQVLQYRKYNEYEMTGGTCLYLDPTDLSRYDTDQENMTVETIEEDLLNDVHLVPDEVTAEGVQ